MATTRYRLARRTPQAGEAKTRHARCARRNQPALHLARRLQFNFGAETPNRAVLRQQPFRMLLIKAIPVGLAIGTKGTAHIRAFIVIESQPIQTIHDLPF